MDIKTATNDPVLAEHRLAESWRRYSQKGPQSWAIAKQTQTLV